MKLFKMFTPSTNLNKRTIEITRKDFSFKKSVQINH